MRPPTRRSLATLVSAVAVLILTDDLLTYRALSDPGAPLREGSPATAWLLARFGLAGGLALDALVRILIFMLALRYIYTRARAWPRVVPLYWGAGALLLVINGAIVVSNVLTLATVMGVLKPP
ncbi:MAG: hypothetical protein RXR82_08580 [Nitrososphaeria archaeon]